MQEERKLDEQEIRQRVLDHHQDNVSMMLKWVGIEEEHAAYLGRYENVVKGLSNLSLEDWVLVRAAMLHIARSEGLHSEHNRWLGREISAAFQNDALDNLLYLTLDTRLNRPMPQLDSEELYSSQQLTHRETTYYYSRAALGILVSREDPERAIDLLEELDSIFFPRIRYFHPGKDKHYSLERDISRLPILYERVGRFEDALSFLPVSLTHTGWNSPPADIAVRRLNGWLNRLSEYGSASDVERCLDVIYQWLDKASDVDDEERDRIEECPRSTRQFWAWYYGNSLGRLAVARPSLPASLLDDTEAGEWEKRLARCRTSIRGGTRLLGTIPETSAELLQRL